MSSRTRAVLFFGLSLSLGLVAACAINSQPVPPGFSDGTGGGHEEDASTNQPTTGSDAGGGTGAVGDADADSDGGDASDLDGGDGGDDGGDAGDGG